MFISLALYVGAGKLLYLPCVRYGKIQEYKINKVSVQEPDVFHVVVVRHIAVGRNRIVGIVPCADRPVDLYSGTKYNADSNRSGNHDLDPIKYWGIFVETSQTIFKHSEKNIYDTYFCCFHVSAFG